jgi:hypothetical protein
MGTGTRWIDSRSPIEICTEHSPMMTNYVCRVPVFRRKPPRVRIRVTFSLLTWISFYVSSRRVRPYVHIEITPKISLDQIDHDDVFTVQAVTRCIIIVGQLDFPISSLESIQLDPGKGNRTSWVECRSRIVNRTVRSRVMEDFVSQRLVFQKNLHNFRHEWHSLF